MWRLTLHARQWRIVVETGGFPNNCGADTGQIEKLSPDERQNIECPRQESNLRTWLRRPMLYPLSYEGGVVSLPEKTFAPRVVRANF